MWYAVQVVQRLNTFLLLFLRNEPLGPNLVLCAFSVLISLFCQANQSFIIWNCCRMGYSAPRHKLPKHMLAIIQNFISTFETRLELYFWICCNIVYVSSQDIPVKMINKLIIFTLLKKKTLFPFTWKIIIVLIIFV